MRFGKKYVFYFIDLDHPTIHKIVQTTLQTPGVHMIYIKQIIIVRTNPVYIWDALKFT